MNEHARDQELQRMGEQVVKAARDASGERQFRKKPVVVLAGQFRANSDAPWPFGVVNFGVPKDDNDTSCHPLDGKHWVQTLEGPLIVSDGDWIVRGTHGEFYPVKPNIFAEIYEEVLPESVGTSER